MTPPREATVIALLAQVGKKGGIYYPPPRRRDYTEENLTIAAIALAVLLLVVLVSLVLAAVSRALRRVAPENRRMEPDDPGEDYGRRTGIRVLMLLASGLLFYPIFLAYPAAVIQALRYRGQMNRYAERLKDDFASPRSKQPEDEGW